MLRAIILILLGLQTVVWLRFLAMLLTNPNLAGSGWMGAIIALPLVVFAALALPALILALKRRMLWLALALTLTAPGFALLVL
ncbi:hypothetical protein MicloDRAFT_00020920 [Microvirga lotononidis]|uniref:Uncharacterized protein n=1 Tax=Microvirga lotononidis TaxID=864069 RepID=I4Z069_9HYPH|nr:hypothetical protein MicloDRAFT_00020920 [Microvirga lotononidis]